MKTVAAYRTYRPVRPAAYPNAATRREMLQKFLDGALLIASGAGIAAMILFMLVIL